jgi:hypothetical protein
MTEWEMKYKLEPATLKSLQFLKRGLAKPTGKEEPHKMNQEREPQLPA